MGNKNYVRDALYKEGHKRDNCMFMSFIYSCVGEPGCVVEKNSPFSLYIKREHESVRKRVMNIRNQKHDAVRTLFN